MFASGESAVLSFVTWLSGAEQSGLRGPSTENQEAKQAALLCIKVECCSLKIYLSELLSAEPDLLEQQLSEALLKPLKGTSVLTDLLISQLCKFSMIYCLLQTNIRLTLELHADKKLIDA